MSDNDRPEEEKDPCVGLTRHNDQSVVEAQLLPDGEADTGKIENTLIRFLEELVDKKLNKEEYLSVMSGTIQMGLAQISIVELMHGVLNALGTTYLESLIADKDQDLVAGMRVFKNEINYVMDNTMADLLSVHDKEAADGTRHDSFCKVSVKQIKCEACPIKDTCPVKEKKSTSTEANGLH